MPELPQHQQRHRRHNVCGGGMEVLSVGLVAGVTFTKAHMSLSVGLLHADMVNHEQVDLNI